MSVVRAELTKFRSVPSTFYALGCSTALTVGIGFLYALARVTRPPSDPSGFDATAVSLAGVQLGQIAVGVLGALLITGEYRTGLIRTTFTAVPRRTPVLAAKAVVIASATFALSLPGSFVAFFLGQRVLSREGLDVPLGDPGVLRAVIGGALMPTMVALLGLGLGALLRNSTAAVAVLLGMLFGPQILAGFLPSSLSDRIYPYLPEPAAAAVTTVGHDAASLGAWTGFGVVTIYVVALLAAGAWRLRGNA
jgi:ABC-2 type transport system permease protein